MGFDGEEAAAASGDGGGSDPMEIDSAGMYVQGVAAMLSSDLKKRRDAETGGMG